MVIMGFFFTIVIETFFFLSFFLFATYLDKLGISSLSR